MVRDDVAIRLFLCCRRCWWCWYGPVVALVAVAAILCCFRRRCCWCDLRRLQPSEAHYASSFSCNVASRHSRMAVILKLWLRLREIAAMFALKVLHIQHAAGL